MILFEKGIISKDGKGGKRAIRIYPPWDVTDSRKAYKTQAWQLMFFFEILPTNDIDVDKVQKIFQRT